MRNRVFFALVAGILTFGTLAATAQAAVPGWARQERRTRLYVSACAPQLVSAIKSVTGVAPTQTNFDNGLVEVRGFTGNVGIFGYCSNSPDLACPGRPAANLTILTFSSAGSGDALSKLTAVNNKFGNPILFDCNF